MSEALKEAEDRHVHQLGEAYLATRAKWLWNGMIPQSWRGFLSTH